MLCVYAVYLQSASMSASRYLVLDAGNEELATYYEKAYGFQRAREGNRRSLRLYKSTKTIREELAELGLLD